MPKPAPPAPRPPFLSGPAWDITDEEIQEWKQTPGLGFAAYTAERIRDGRYDGGQEIYPPGSAVYKEITTDAVDQAMSLLAERGMAAKTGDRWHAIAPGRFEPDMRRAAAALLARRDDLPPDLTAALDSWKRDLDAREAGQTARPARPPRPPAAAGAEKRRGQS